MSSEGERRLPEVNTHPLVRVGNRGIESICTLCPYLPCTRFLPRRGRLLPYRPCPLHLASPVKMRCYSSSAPDLAAEALVRLDPSR